MTYWSWRGIFFVNVPIGVLLVVLCLRYVPRDPERVHERRPMDLIGMAWLGVGLLALMLSISDLGQKGTRIWSLLFIGSAIVAVLGLGQFARHIRRVANPFISPHLIVGRGFAAVNVINVWYGGAVAGLMALVPLYAVNRYRINALGSGTLLTAEAIAAIVMSTLGAMALRRTGYRQPLYVGAVVVAAGIVALAFRPEGLSAYAWLAAASCVVGVGAGLSLSLIHI